MTRRGGGVAPTTLWVVGGCGPLMLAVTGVVALVRGSGRFNADEFARNLLPNIVFGGLLPLMGALILTRIPRHPIGRLFLVCGLAAALTFPAYGYARLALYDDPGRLPLGVIVGWFSGWIWAWGFIPLMSLGVLLFPDGRPPSPRWRPLVYADLTALALITLSLMFAPGPLVNHPVAENPLGVPLPGQVFAVMGGVGMSLFMIGVVGGAVAVAVRWRRGSADERAQVGWMVLAMVLLVVALATSRGAPALSDLLIPAAAILLPVSVGVAVLRHRLYGIEVVVRRSLVYGTLTVILLAGYALVATIAGALLGSHGDTAAGLAGTAVVAIALAPARSWLQGRADRLLFGSGRDPYAVLSDLGQRLDRNADDDGSVMAEVAAAVAESLRLPYVRVEIGRQEATLVVAEHGSRPADGLHEIPLLFKGELVGRLAVAPRTPRDPFRPADLRLLGDLGRQVGVAAHAMLTGLELQRSRQALVALREDERRRIRRDLHDGLGPALAGVSLGLDAVTRIAADDPGAATELAAQLKQEVDASLVDVRNLVEDLRPPALDQLGLVGALKQQAEHLTERDPGLEVLVDAGDMPCLPAAVEVAAYRIATEALNNVARHASARTCRVAVDVRGVGERGGLVVEVVDDGVGLSDTRRSGIGLSAMRERAVELGGTCTARPGALGGTTVHAWLPLGSP